MAVAELQVQRRRLAIARPADLLTVERLAVHRDRCLAAVHRLREIDLDVAGGLQALLAVGHLFVVDLHGRDAGGGLGLEMEAVTHPAAGGVLRIADAHVVRGARRHLRPELELPGAHRLEANQHGRADAEGMLHRVRFHVLVETKIDCGRPRDGLVTVVDVGVHLERGGDDANDDGGRHQQNGNRCQPPTFAKCLRPGH